MHVYVYVCVYIHIYIYWVGSEVGRIGGYEFQGAVFGIDGVRSASTSVDLRRRASNQGQTRRVTTTPNKLGNRTLPPIYLHSHGQSQRCSLRNPQGGMVADK